MTLFLSPSGYFSSCLWVSGSRSPSWCHLTGHPVYTRSSPPPWTTQALWSPFPAHYCSHVKCILWSLSMTSIKAQLQHKTALVLLLWQTFYPCLKPAELLILLPRCLSWAAQFDENCCNFFCVSATFSTYFCIYFGFQPVLEIPGSQRKKCDQQY